MVCTTAEWGSVQDATVIYLIQAAFVLGQDTYLSNTHYYKYLFVLDDSTSIHVLDIDGLVETTHVHRVSYEHNYDIRVGYVRH